MTTPDILSDISPASKWAWDQVSSPNIAFDPDLHPFALVLLGFARLADVALSSRSGGGYDGHSPDEVQDLTGVGTFAMASSICHSVAAGMLVQSERTFGNSSRLPQIVFRIPEEAFV